MRLHEILEKVEADHAASVERHTEALAARLAKLGASPDLVAYHIADFRQYAGRRVRESLQALRREAFTVVQ